MLHTQGVAEFLQKNRGSFYANFKKQIYIRPFKDYVYLQEILTT